MNQEEKADIYCKKISDYDREVKKLETYPISEQNKNIIKRYIPISILLFKVNHFCEKCSIQVVLED